MATEEYPLALVIRAVDKATGPLREINAKIKKFTDPLQKLSKDAGFPKLFEAFKGVGSAASKVGDEAGKLIMKFAAVAAAAGFAGYTILRSTVDAGDKLAEMAQRVGLSVDAYAQLQFAAAQADVEQEQFNAAMDQFNKRLGEAKAGTGPLLGFLNKVGPGLATQVKHAKTTEEAFGLMVKAFEAIPDPARRAALSAAVFGKSGLQMGQFLGQGSKAIEAQRKKFLDLAGSQEAFAKNSSDLDNAMRETSVAFDGLKNAAAAELFPALNELAGVLTRFLADNREGLRAWAKETGAAISAWVKGGGMERLIQSFKEIAATAGRVIDMVGGPAGLAAIFAGIQVLPLVASLGSLAASFGSLAVAMAPFAIALAPVALAMAPFALAAAGLAAAGYQIYKNWEPLKQFFMDIADSIGRVITNMGGLKEFASHPLQALSGVATDIGSTLFGNYENNHRSAFVGLPADVNGARPQSAPGGRLAVDFANMPKGTRVTPDKQGEKYFDLNLGYSNLVMQ